jgi:hypothetical protein
MIFIKPVLAQCPVCIVTVGGGMLLAEKLGVDSLLVSIWISALNTAIALWLAPKFKIKFLKNPYILSVILYTFTLFYFYFTDQIGFKNNQILGLDKIILGQTFGLLIMFLAVFLDKFIRSKNNNKVFFYYQKVIIPVSLLIITTLIFKFVFNL